MKKVLIITGVAVGSAVIAVTVTATIGVGIIMSAMVAGSSSSYDD